MISLLTLPFRILFGSARLGWRTGRLIGPSRALFFGAGFGLGVLAMSPGARRVALAGVAKGADKVRAARAEPPAVDPTTGVPVTG